MSLKAELELDTDANAYSPKSNSDTGCITSADVVTWTLLRRGRDEGQDPRAQEKEKCDQETAHNKCGPTALRP